MIFKIESTYWRGTKNNDMPYDIPNLVTHPTPDYIDGYDHYYTVDINTLEDLLNIMKITQKPVIISGEDTQFPTDIEDMNKQLFITIYDGYVE